MLVVVAAVVVMMYVEAEVCTSSRDIGNPEKHGAFRFEGLGGIDERYLH